MSRLFPIALCYILLTACGPDPDPLEETRELLQDSLTQFDPQRDEILGYGRQLTGDLDSMIERRMIRALVLYNRTSYFIDGTQRRGLTFEALTLFETYINKKLGLLEKGVPKMRVIFVPVTRDRLFPMLEKGYGDLAVAGITITGERKKEFDFSLPTLTDVKQILVTGPGSKPITSLTDLSGLPVHVRKSSTYFDRLKMLSDSLEAVGFPPVQLIPADEQLEDEDLLELVHSGAFPATVVKKPVAKLWAQVLDSLRLHSDFPIHQKDELGWAMRKHSPQLMEAVNDFVRQNRKGTTMGNILYNRYLNTVKYIRNPTSETDLKKFHDMRHLFEKYGEMYGIDWIILAAQAYQESKLNQSLVSRAGAVGVMQIKPSTAADPNIGIQNVYELENNIHAGAKYLRFIADRYFGEEPIDSLNRGLFSVASYNAGPIRIQRLRRAAEAQGLNPNVWFDQVELLAARDIGRETVQYVSNIYKYYLSYRSLRLYAEQTGKTLVPE